MIKINSLELIFFNNNEFFGSFIKIAILKLQYINKFVIILYDR